MEQKFEAHFMGIGALPGCIEQQIQGKENLIASAMKEPGNTMMFRDDYGKIPAPPHDAIGVVVSMKVILRDAENTIIGESAPQPVDIIWFCYEKKLAQNQLNVETRVGRVPLIEEKDICVIVKRP